MKEYFSNVWKGPKRASKVKVSTDPQVLIEWERRNLREGFYPHKRGTVAPDKQFIVHWRNDSWPPKTKS